MDDDSGSGGVSACPARTAQFHPRLLLATVPIATYLVCMRDRRTCENVLEGELNVAGVQGGRLDERKVVLAWQ